MWRADAPSNKGKQEGVQWETRGDKANTPSNKERQESAQFFSLLASARSFTMFTSSDLIQSLVYLQVIMYVLRAIKVLKEDEK